VPRLEVEAAVQRRHGWHEQRHGAAGAEQRPGGAQLGHVVADVLEHTHVDHRIERCDALLVQLVGGDLRHGEARMAGRAGVQFGEHVLGWLDGGDVVPCIGELHGNRAHPSADLEHAAAEVGFDRFADPREETVGAGERCQLLGGAEQGRASGGLGP